jgi:hypothetical protein
MANRGETVCHVHGGGHNSRGMANAQFKHGRYSKELPLRLASAYQEARQDSDLHTLVDEIALTQARLKELLQRLESSDLGHAWLALNTAWKTFSAYRRSGDVEKMAQALGEVETAIGRGAQDYLLWTELTSKIQLLADLRVREHRRLLDLEAMIPSERATLIFGLLQQAVHKAIVQHADPVLAQTILRAIQESIKYLDTRGDMKRVGP